jgi:hypothetical protein
MTMRRIARPTGIFAFKLSALAAACACKCARTSKIVDTRAVHREQVSIHTYTHSSIYSILLYERANIASSTIMRT